jgi:prolyl-tRNA synthetase
MRQSKLFSKTRKNAPKDETSKNAELLIRGGYIHKEMAGVYSFLPLGWRVMQKIIGIIREEMNAIEGQELFLTALQDRTVWQQTNRWDDAHVDIWFKTRLKNDTELGLGFTHEEPLTALMKNHINSYKDLPAYAYQFQTKFRNELRAKSGIMRGREFIMKDLYSFCRDQKQHDEYYERAKQAYIKIFERVGLGDQTYVTFASGGTFSKYSHEFQTLTDAGEDIIYVDEKKKIAVNKEVYNPEVLVDLGLNKDDLVERKAVEVGNIFGLGTKFSDAFGLMFADEDGKSKPVIMGSYGIGPGRVMGTIVETYADANGIVWPESVAPFGVHLIAVGKNQETLAKAEALYVQLQKAGVEVLFDDRIDTTAGAKFADADLLGMPWRLVVSDKTGDNVEIKKRASDNVEIVSVTEVIKKISK